VKKDDFVKERMTLMSALSQRKTSILFPAYTQSANSLTFIYDRRLLTCAKTRQDFAASIFKRVLIKIDNVNSKPRNVMYCKQLT